MFVRLAPRSALAAIAPFVLLLAACGGQTQSAPSDPPPPTPTSGFVPPPTGACASDADCRMQDAPACGCVPALASSPAIPSPTPCFAPPCLNREPFCDAATHSCALRTAAPPADPGAVPES